MAGADPTSTKTVCVRLDGRVQGVWFRGWTVQEAAALGLDGWVRNNFDGTVEAVFSGEAAAVDRMVALCRQGPRFARVDSLKVSPAPPLPRRGFRQIR